MDLLYFRTLARYNGWANQRLFEACSKLPHEEYFKTRPAFFKSIHGALSHILLVDRIWLGRINGKPMPKLPLNQILYGDFAGLKVAREAEDGIIVNIVDELDGAALERIVAFTRTDGAPAQLAMKFLLGHVFNHATHHRGQVHDMLTQTALAPPELDLFVYLIK